jgi:hypothetical protein
VSAFASWRAFYESDLQGLYALLLVPSLWLAWRLARGRPAAPGVHPPAAAFVDAFALTFAVQTLLDPLATGPLARTLGGHAPRALGLAFVLLGDFRVFLLVAHLAGARCALGPALREAALLTPVVPLAALGAEKALSALAGPLPGQALWLLHETAFLGMVAFLRRRVIARRGASAPPALQAYLRAVTAYVAVYYGLWALSDALLLAGAEWAWGLRVLPNQLYYALFVPYVSARFFARS